jgi:hypothetical protein
MIFALIDFLEYRLRRGKYSHERLLADGAFLAGPSTLWKLENVRDGDILFSHAICWTLGWVVMYVQDSPFCHTALLTAKRNVIEATLSGVVEQPASSYFDGKYYLRLGRRNDLTVAQEQGAIAYARAQVGKPFNWAGVIYLGWLILIGGHRHYNPKHGLDILLILTVLGILFRRFSIFASWLLAASGVIYILMVVVNRVRLRHVSN